MPAACLAAEAANRRLGRRCGEGAAKVRRRCVLQELIIVAVETSLAIGVRSYTGSEITSRHCNQEITVISHSHIRDFVIPCQLSRIAQILKVEAPRDTIFPDSHPKTLPGDMRCRVRRLASRLPSHSTTAQSFLATAQKTMHPGLSERFRVLWLLASHAVIIEDSLVHASVRCFATKTKNERLYTAGHPHVTKE